MRLFPTLLLLAVLKLGCAEETIRKLNKICKKKDYNVLITELNQIEELSTNQSSYRWYMAQNRETIPNHFEQVFELINDVKGGNPWVASSSGTIVHTYKISFIRTEKKIIFYTIEGFRKHRLKENSYDYQYYKKRNFFKLFEHNRKYQKTYGKRLRLKKLFNLNHTFGYSCGSTEAKTYLMDSVDNLVQIKSSSSIATLYYMLIDENVEIQLYGYYGFTKLKHQGFILSEGTAKMMVILESKQGSVAYCDKTQNKLLDIQQVLRTIQTSD